ncbi:hypothetical protein GCM10022630_24950 [Thermobifida alba]
MSHAAIAVKLAATSPSGRKFHAFVCEAKSAGGARKAGIGMFWLFNGLMLHLAAVAMFVTTVTGWTWW